MKKLLCVLAVAAAVVPAIAFADGGNSCAAAQEIFPGQTYSGDTSTSTSFIGSFGPLPSPGPDQAFKFTSDGLVTTAISVTGSYNYMAALVTACTPASPFPLENVTAPALTGGTASLPIDTGTAGTALTAGTTYYVIMTGNPSDNSGPSGTYNFGTPTPLPVTLQQFSID